MNRIAFLFVACVMVPRGFAATVQTKDASALRLVPFPKEVRFEVGQFRLRQPLVLEAGGDVARLFGRMIGAELERSGLHAPDIRPRDGNGHVLRLSPKPGGPLAWPSFRKDATLEDYVLQIRPDGIAISAPGSAGLFYGVQTLCQLIRANRQGVNVPCLTIRDWPSIQWRAFQDDLTRGPSSTLDTLKREVALGAYLRMNLFTYYMEYQYAFKKHPILGPKDGSLTREDLKALVAYGAPLHVDILGNQQSFAHFHHILKHKEYEHLRETAAILSPAVEASYQLLDDLYSEVVPLLPLPFFNVCCDETQGLGTGPSKALAEKIGVGGVYVRHIRRIHDLLKDKYGKRMMMWGDIILHHPEHLKEISTDTIMLTWGYHAGDNFEDQIVPFARAGYDFFVCPGVSCWSRILPDFGVATVNIRNFVRDGAKHGAMGVLNTAWDDDGESFGAPNWHGYAWGAECAWNASATSLEDFNRRIGAVLFGEEADHFGQAIELLSQTHRLAGMDGMNNRRFWQNDLTPPEDGVEKKRVVAQRLLAIVRPAIRHLRACQEEAAANADLLDYFLFGARRMELIGERILDGFEAASAYRKACESSLEEAAPLVAKAEALVRETRELHETLGKQFEELWRRENKPYALNWTMQRYGKAIATYEALAARLAATRKNAEAGKPLPSPKEIGLDLL